MRGPHGRDGCRGAVFALPACPRWSARPRPTPPHPTLTLYPVPAGQRAVRRGVPARPAGGHQLSAARLRASLPARPAAFPATRPARTRQGRRGGGYHPARLGRTRVLVLLVALPPPQSALQYLRHHEHLLLEPASASAAAEALDIFQAEGQPAHPAQPATTAAATATTRQLGKRTAHER